MDKHEFNQTLQKLLAAAKDSDDSDTRFKEMGEQISSVVSNEEMSEVMRGVVENTGSSQTMYMAMNAIPPEEKTKIAEETYQENVPVSKQKENARNTLISIGQPSAETRDAVWLTVVRTFAFIMLICTVFLISGVVTPKTENAIITGELIFSIFTATSGFLAGLFVQSPTKN